VRIGYTHDEHTERVARWLPDNLMARPSGGPVEEIEIRQRRLEACVGSVPLNDVTELPEGAVGVVNLTLEINGDTHLVSAPVLNEGGSTSPLI
jgi:hypothetical protein